MKNATKVERQVPKAATARLLINRIGQQFNVVVTGASEKDTWVRISEPIAEGRVVKGSSGLDVGDRVRVELVDVDPRRGSATSPGRAGPRARNRRLLTRHLLRCVPSGSTGEHRLASEARSARIDPPVRENSMKPKRTSVVLVALLAFAFSAQSHAQAPGISLMIEKHASLTREGIVVIRIRIVCGPFAGMEEFQDGHAGGGQDKTGASSETGIDGTVICDGIERTHTAHLSPLDEATFKPGPASVSASLFVCTLAGEEQMCFSGATSRRVIVRGGRRAA